MLFKMTVNDANCHKMKHKIKNTQFFGANIQKQRLEEFKWANMGQLYFCKTNL